jgi:NLI interacting factor-like phosphatase
MVAINPSVERSPSALVLDLEGTLISNAVSCFPRPGLSPFLDFCRTQFKHIVLFMTVAEERVRAIVSFLIAEGSVPAWVRDIEIVQWSGATKDLRFVSGADIKDILLVDDLINYVHADQRQQWVAIASFASPYADTDRELVRVTEELCQRLGISPSDSPFRQSPRSCCHSRSL